MVAAHLGALAAAEQGIYNVAGMDTLPLSEAVALSGGTSIPVLEPIPAPLYALRRFSSGFDFRYDLARVRFHLGGVLDGSKAAQKLGYRPATGIACPRSGEKVRLAG